MLDTTSRPLLEIAGLEAWYGESHILHGMNFEVRQGGIPVNPENFLPELVDHDH